MPGNDSISKTEVFKAIVSEAAGFYGLIITVASTFLGGTLVFLEKIAPCPAEGSLWVLASGWLLLVASIICICWVRLVNLESGRLALEGQHEQAKKLDGRTRCASRLGVAFLGTGIILVLLFGLFNVGRHGKNDAKEQAVSMNKTGDCQPAKPIKGSIPFGSAVAPDGQKSIPFGSTGPQQPASPQASQQGTTQPSQAPSQPSGGSSSPPASNQSDNAGQ